MAKAKRPPAEPTAERGSRSAEAAKAAPARDPLSDALGAAAKEASEARRGPARAREVSFEEFFREFPPAANYVWGRHTRAICAEIQAAVEAIEAGGTRYTIVNVPPRHGKSDQVSRRAPAWFLLRNPDREAILATYGAELSEGFSRAARRCFNEAAPRYGLRLSADLNQVGAWGIDGHTGAFYAIGLGGAITGRGAALLIVDDYCKNREEAESETVRERVWDGFRSDLMTRIAPAHAVIVVATRWHEDDLVGRIHKEMESSAEFPRFSTFNFPAVETVGDEERWLFPERFGADWYRTQRGLVGEYGWQSLYQGDPRPRTGNLLRADLVEIVEPSDWPFDLATGLPRADGIPSARWFRGWDLASSEKQRVKEDPDYTVGTLAGWDGQYLWVQDVARGRWTAPARNERMAACARLDGPRVEVRIEVVAGYKDTGEQLREMLRGQARVSVVVPKGDKVARASILEPLFEGGRVKILKAPWNDEWLKELKLFPKVKHDDQVDSLVAAVADALGPSRRARLSL